MLSINPRIAVLTLYTPEIASYAKISVRNHEGYCRRHGYEFVCEPATLDATRAPTWSKVLLMQRRLSQFDWLFWIDADALFMNMSTPIESRIDTAFDLIVAGRNPMPPRLCGGEILIRGSSWSAWYLDTLWRTSTCGPHHEQSAMIALMDRPDVRSRLKILPFGGMSKRTNSYQAGDWIIHFPARTIADRVRLITRYAARATP